MADPPPERELIFVTGATGYVGGRLAPRLLEAGYRVRCLTRSAKKLRSRPWADHPRLEIIEGGVTSAALAPGLRGCAAAYYLVHSMMAAGAAYRAHDRALASAFAEAAAEAGVKRIIYLGGLGETGPNLSQHLASRREVETALASTGVPVTSLRAAMIIGSGSASFEILRYLVERLPIMVTPRWVSTECQPIAIRNVLRYLEMSLETPATVGQTLDIGGADVRTYAELMQEMAASLQLPKRLIIPVPLLTPRLSSLWIHLVTPLSHRIARPLAEGLRNRVVCRDDRASRLMPQKLFTARDAIDLALQRHGAARVETSWSDAGALPGDPDWAGGRVFVDRREIEIDASADVVYDAVCRIGGGQGYYAADWLWRVRGAMDRLVGGPGLRRGRRHPERVSHGDALDFWRVTRAERGRLLELWAEMKLPGEATLTFEIESVAPGRHKLAQTARFRPRGLAGLLYWAAVLPLHGYVFTSMQRGIKRAAEAAQARTSAETTAPTQSG